MLSVNVVERTLRLRINDRVGTGFVYDHDGRQYLLTARHIWGESPGLGYIEVYRNAQWDRLAAESLGHSGDILVLSVNDRLTTRAAVPPVHRVGMGQDVYILGFPLNLKSQAHHAGHTVPIPFVKKSLLSAALETPPSGQVLYLDAILAGGFSGGPVLAYTPSAPAPQRWALLGLVSGYISEHHRGTVRTRDGEYSVQSPRNTGITVGWSLAHAVRVIHQRPEGFELG